MNEHIFPGKLIDDLVFRAVPETAPRMQVKTQTGTQVYVLWRGDYVRSPLRDYRLVIWVHEASPESPEYGSTRTFVDSSRALLVVCRGVTEHGLDQAIRDLLSGLPPSVIGRK